MQDHRRQAEDDYIISISKSNSQNAKVFTKLPYQELDEANEFKIIFDDITICPQNVAKFAVVAVMIVILVVGVYVPFNSPTVTLALRQSAANPNSTVPVTQGTSFGSGAVESPRRQIAEYAQNVTLTVHGKSEVFSTTSATVRDVLAEKSIRQDYSDGVFPKLDEIVNDNDVIVVDKMVSHTETSLVPIEFEEQRIEEPAMRKGEEVVVQNGATGERSIVYVVKSVGGNVVERSEFNNLTITEPLKRIIKFGSASVKDNGSIVTVPDTDVKQFALEQVKERGWPDSEFTCLVPLWQRESGWRTTAGNPISGAYGIPQALPGSKMATFGDDWRTNPQTQIKWGINYIAGRYGTPCSAWSTWQSRGWY
jgi:hypothetical protein